MPDSNPRFGPLTFGTLLGAIIGLVIAGYGMYAISSGMVDRSYNALVFLALGAAIVGGSFGVFAEVLKQHSTFAYRPWAMHLLRPVCFATIPYLLMAVSLDYFGHGALMSGFGFFVFGFLFSCWGVAIIIRRRADPEFDRRFTRSDTDDSDSVNE